MKLILVVLLLALNLQTRAMSFDEIKLKAKDVIEKIVGSELVQKIFGKSKEVESLVMPEIPKIIADSKALDIYHQKADEVVFDKKKMEEYNVSYVHELITATREVPANRDEIGKWYNTLYQGATREGIYRALVLDEYYRRLENYEELASPKVRAFTIAFMDKYINKQVTEDKISDLNLYSLKRIITEDALDIADTYILSNKKEDFLVWYAMFSAQMGADYPIWENRLRASTNSKQHLAWAQKMPLQFVKSELILKLHLVYNHLQKLKD